MLEGQNTSQTPEAAGYRSKEHKKTFTIAVGILGAVFLLAQFIVPFVVMMVAMPTFMVSGIFSMKEANPARSAYWNGRIWYPETQVNFDASSGTVPRLKALSFDQLQQPEDIADIPVDGPRLLAGTDRLWAISSSGIGYYQKGEFLVYPDARALGDISRPFLHNGVPAVIESQPGGLAFITFRDGAWQDELRFALTPEDNRCCVDRLQVLSQEGRLHVFMKFGNTLYYHEGLTFHESEGDDAWKVIAQAGHRWYTLLTKNGLAVFIDTAGDIPMIKGYKQQGDRWISFFAHKHFITSGLGAFAVDDADRIALMVEAFPGSLKLFTIEGQEVVGTIKHGRSTPFPKGFMAMMLVPQSIMMFMPLILAFIFSILMSKHRVTYHTTETGRAPFASLTRRAFAQIIDAIILGGPLIVVWFMFMSSIFNFEDAFFTSGTKMVAMFGLMFGGFFWAFLCLIVFSFMEGKWGTTPGKWALGIRVFGTELEYCGFWRALVRNLLKLVDGFFSFMVGIMVIALSEHWQRVGDMAARTIVVDVKRR